MPLVSIPQSDEQEFSSLLAKLGLDRNQFILTLTNHPAATFGPRVKTIKISWKNVLEVEYGAEQPMSWIAQFRADWESGLMPKILADAA